MKGIFSLSLFHYVPKYLLVVENPILEIMGNENLDLKRSEHCAEEGGREIRRRRGKGSIVQGRR